MYRGRHPLKELGGSQRGLCLRRCQRQPLELQQHPPFPQKNCFEKHPRFFVLDNSTINFCRRKKWPIRIISGSIRQNSLEKGITTGNVSETGAQLDGDSSYHDDRSSIALCYTYRHCMRLHGSTRCVPTLVGLCILMPHSSISSSISSASSSISSARGNFVYRKKVELLIRLFDLC